jgi:hypothetical protein
MKCPSCGRDEIGALLRALGMSVFVAGVGAQAATGPAAPAQNVTATAPDERGSQQTSKTLDRLYAAADVLNGKMDHSLFEIDALAVKLGSDPTAIFHFVRDEIRYEPYVGVLRGALGTLLCRAGNSLDRSLLLAALLQKAGFKTQIASGQLTTKQAQDLVSRLFEPVKRVPSAVPSVVKMAAEIARAAGGDQAKLVQVADQTQQNGERRNKDLVNYVHNETTNLTNLFTNAGVDAGAVTSNDQLLAESSEHYWVQYQNSNGEWVDLDSAFADAGPGKTVATLANAFAPDAIPEELYHHLRIKLTLRTAEVVDGHDGATSDTVLVDQELRIADQQGQGITVANSPVPMPNFLTPGASLADALASTKGYQTLLQVGSQLIPGKYFDLDGNVSDTLGGPEGDAVTNAGGIGKSVSGLSGGMNSVFGGGDAPAGTATRIIGEWVDYSVVAPGPHGSSPIVRSYHRDIVAPATVKSWTADKGAETAPTNLGKDALRLRLMWNSDLLPVTGTIVPDYAGFLQMQALTQNRQLADLVAKMVSGLTSERVLPNAPRLPIANTLLAAGTMEMANTLTNAQFPGLKSYFAQAGLIAFETAGTGPSSVPYLKEGYDIVAYDPRIIANPAKNTENVNRAVGSLRITQGVLATRLEWALLAKPGVGKHASVLNTTEILAAAQEQRVPTLVIRPGAAGLKQLAGLSVSPSIKAELSESLEAGNTLVLPAGAPTIDGGSQIAWWRLHNSTGEISGVVPDGRGGAMVEYLANSGVVFGSMTCFLDAGKSKAASSLRAGAVALCFVGAYFGGGGLILAGMKDAEEGAALFFAFAAVFDWLGTESAG